LRFYIYILHSISIERYYIGYSSDPWKRLEEHLQNDVEHYTGKAKDWELKAVYFVSENRSEAMQMERFIKKQKSRLSSISKCDKKAGTDDFT